MKLDFNIKKTNISIYKINKLCFNIFDIIEINYFIKNK